MKIRRKLLPIKAHFFFFMSAMGPILPQMTVYGKELGVSSAVMGTITGILPFLYLIAKPLFGMLVDVYRDYRKFLFLSLLVCTSAAFALMALIPHRELLRFHRNDTSGGFWRSCNDTDLPRSCDQKTVHVTCRNSCFNESLPFIVHNYSTMSSNYDLCINVQNASQYSSCGLDCLEDIEVDNLCILTSWPFWLFVLAIAVGSIGFNVGNSISDAICCDVVAEQEADYGRQRVWGSVGFGLAALLSGYVVDLVSSGGSSVSYMPAFVVMAAFSLLDVLVCMRLKLPAIEPPENILKEFSALLKDRRVVAFLCFAVCAGILDSTVIFYLFWYLEDLATATGTPNVKLLEGLIVAAETLGGEIIFFSISGKILERFGHVRCFSMCFVNYAMRLVLISVAPSPWWILPVEFVFQGPTYALTYSTIVAYADELAPQGASATMQGIAAGMDDGIGYAVGSFVGGLMFKYMDDHRVVWQIFGVFGVVCSVAHLVLHKTVLGEPASKEEEGIGEPPGVQSTLLSADAKVANYN